MRTLLLVIFLTGFQGLLLSQTVELKYNLEKDKIYRVKSSSVQDQTMTMQGMERKTETKNVSYFSLKMLDSKSDFFIAEVKFDTIKTTVSMPSMELTSAEKGDINSEDPVDVTNCILNRLSNSTLVVRMGYTGHVQDIMNHQVIEETVLQGVDSLKGQAVMAKGQLQMLVGKDALAGMIEGVTAYLPNRKVDKGAKWESSFVSKSGGIGMAFTTNYMLQELSDEKAMLKGDVIVEPATSAPAMMNGAEVTNELRGLGESDMEIDINTGWVKHTSSKVHLSGNMHIKAPGQNVTLPIEAQITNETTVVE
jgi:hypothetical protein